MATHTTSVEREALLSAVEAWNIGNVDRYLELYAPEAVLHGYPGVQPGRAGIAAFYDGFWAAFPGSRIEIHDILQEGDRLACRFVLTGTHGGLFQGLAPTQRAIELPGITILKFAGTRCVERWSQADFSSLLQQLTSPK